MELQDRVAVVTGGGGPGTGRAIALRLAAEGAAVVAMDVDQDGGRETVRQVEAAGGRAAFVRADVVVEPDVRRTVAFAEATFGGLDVLVNSAGGTDQPFFPDAPADHWGRTLDLNLRGPMFAIQHALPAMRRRGGGAVVNVASVAGLGTLANASVEYAVAKAGLIRLTAVLAPCAERDRVRVNCVVPNWIATEQVLAELAAMPPDERPELPEPPTPPEDIAAAVVDLLRDEALAGRVLVCWSEGGWHLIEPGDVGYARFALRREPPTDPTGPGGAGR